MNQPTSSLLNVFRPKVVHRIPGRLRLRIPKPPGNLDLPVSAIDDWTVFFRNHEGIETIEYNPLTRTSLIKYDCRQITEDEILATIDRFFNLIVASIPKFLGAPKKALESIPQRIKDYLSEHPVSLTDEEPLELPDGIWR